MESGRTDQVTGIMDLQTEIVSTEKLTEQRWLNLFLRTYRRGDQTFRWFFASRKPTPSVARKPDAVIIVPILIDAAPGGEPRLVATREYRVVVEANEWGLPAGLIDGDEPVVEAARRELLEETGYELADVIKISPPNYSSSGLTDELVTIVFCTCRKPTEHRQRLEAAEQIEVHLLTLPEIDALIDTQEPINGRAWQAFYLFHRLGRLL
jgi:ADP-ribose pyrophosphatase